MSEQHSITQEQVKTLFDYHPDGYLIWKTNRKKIVVGARAGSFGAGSGYFSVMVNGKNHYTHRLIFLMHHGYLPIVVDHIDMNKTNNRVENLRASDHTKNKGNCLKKKHNKSGFKGVSWSKKNKKWQACLTINYKPTHLGFFTEKEEAALAYNKAAINHFGEFARINELP